MQPRGRVDPDRSSAYSKWHSGDLGRGPGYWAYTTDIDFVEVTYDNNPDEPVVAAVIEEKQLGHDLTRLQLQIYPRIAKALDAPFYVVRHNLETEPSRRKWTFHVENFSTHEVLVLNEEAYVDWLYEIRKQAKKSR